MKLTRREALKLGLVGSGVLLSPFGFAKSAWAQSSNCTKEMLPPSTQTPQLSPLIKRFDQPLRIPEPLKPSLSKTYQVVHEGQTFDQPIDYYQIEMRKQTVEIVPAKDGKPAITAEAWTYNGSFPGPLIHQQKTANPAFALSIIWEKMQQEKKFALRFTCTEWLRFPNTMAMQKT